MPNSTNPPESKFISIFESIDNGFYSKALHEINKCLKKYTEHETFQCLKALVLLRTGKSGEAQDIVNSLLSKCNVEETSLTVLLTFLKESQQTKKLDDFLSKSVSVYPYRTDLHKAKIFRSINNGDYENLQKDCQNLIKYDSSCHFWTIMSLIIQGKFSHCEKPEVYLSLAERFLRRNIDNDKVKSHNELNVYLYLLEQLNRYSDALDVTENHPIFNRMYFSDYRYLYLDKKIEYVEKLDEWDKALLYAKNIWKSDQDEWSPWSTLSNLVFKKNKNKQLEVSCMERYKTFSKLVESSVGKGNRAAYLAQMDFYINNRLCKLEQPTFMKPLIEILEEYSKSFSKSEIFASDIYQLVFIGLTEEEKIKFCTDLKKASIEKFHESVSDNKSCFAILNAFRVGQYNGIPPTLDEIFCQFFSKNKLTRGFFQDDYQRIFSEAEKTKDLSPFDPLIHMAVQNLSRFNKNVKKSDVSSHLLAYHWLSFLSQKYCPFDHHSKILLIRLLGNAGGLCASQLQLKLMNLNRVKLNLACSVGHLMIQPELSLTCWAPFMSNVSSGGDPGISQSLSDSRIVTNPISKSDLDNQVSVRRRRNNDFKTSLDDYYARMKTLRANMLRDTEDAIASAFNSDSYAQIIEIIQLYNSLKYSNAFIHGITEFYFWRSAILPFNYDQLHEEMTNIVQSNKLLEECIPKLVDNRDDDVVPSFLNRDLAEGDKEKSFDHVKSWLSLRNISNRLFGNVLLPLCTFINNSMSNNEDITKCPEDNLNILNSITAIEKDLESFEREHPKTCKKVETKSDYILPLEVLISNYPTVIPEEINMIQLYLYGGYADLIRYILKSLRVLHQVFHQTGSIDELLRLFDNIRESLISQNSMMAQFSQFESVNEIPHCLKHATYIVEIISHGIIFISSISTLIRPLTKKLSKSKQINKNSKKESPLLDSMRKIGQYLSSNLVGPLLKEDSLIHKFQQNIKNINKNLSKENEGYKDLVNSMIAVSSALAVEILSKELIEKHPVIVPRIDEHQCVENFNQLINDWSFAFDQLSLILDAKLSYLRHVSENELSFYSSLNVENLQIES